jgi:hypothetical protein
MIGLSLKANFLGTKFSYFFFHKIPPFDFSLIHLILVQTFKTISIRFILIISFRLRLGLSSRVFP